MPLALIMTIVCALFCKVDCLTCIQCIAPNIVGSCIATNQTCPFNQTQCISATVTISGSAAYTSSVQGCAYDAECASGSVSMTNYTMAVNTTCCGGDLCNNQTPAAPAKESANGNKCYTCVNGNCNNTVDCNGIEDSCMASTGHLFNQTETVKGCLSSSLCPANGIGDQYMQSLGFTFTCCKGNLCNGAYHISQSVLLLLVSVAAVIIFH